MKKTLGTLAFGLAISGASWADDSKFFCKNGEKQRRVEINYPHQSKVPCEVRYYKDTESPGQHQSLWRAENKEGYCENKANEFVDKLRGWGWNCATASTTAH